MPLIDPKRLKERYEQARQARAPYERLFEDAAELILPTRLGFTSKQAEGTERYSRLFDSTAVWANEVFAAQLAGQLINPAMRWLALRTEDPELEKERDVQEWLREAETRVLRVLSNPLRRFYPQTHETFLELGAFGTAVFATSEDLKFLSVPLPDVYIEEDASGQAVALYRRYQMRAREAAARYGQRLGDKLLREAAGNPAEKWEFVQAVLPRDEADPTNRRPWVSIHFHEAEGRIVEVSGFREFPFAVVRWTRIAGEPYGRGPGMTVLADIRMLQRLKEVIIRGLQKVVDPPLLVPDDGFIGPLSTRPSALNYYRAGMQDKVEPLVTGARPEIGEQFVQTVRETVLRAFFIDPNDAQPMKTHIPATAILDRRDERFRRMTPMLARLQAEWLAPVISRVLAVMGRRNMLPPAPDILEGQPLRPEFVSTAAIAQQMTEVDNMERFLARVAPVMELDPAAAQMLDSGEFVKVVARNMAIPMEVLRDPEEVAQIREQAAAQMEREQQAQEAVAVSQAIKNIATAQR